MLWENAAETIAGFYATAFAHTPFLFSGGSPLPPTVDVGNCTMLAVVNSCNTSYNSGAPWRFVMRDSGYSGSGTSTAPPWASTLPTGYQEFLPHEPAGQEALDLIGSPYYGQWFEVYWVDCETSSNWSDFDTYNQYNPWE